MMNMYVIMSGLDNGVLTFDNISLFASFSLYVIRYKAMACSMVLPFHFVMQLKIWYLNDLIFIRLWINERQYINGPVGQTIGCLSEVIFKKE